MAQKFLAGSLPHSFFHHTAHLPPPVRSEQQSRKYHHFTKFISVMSKPLKSICKLWRPAPWSLHSFNSIHFYFIKYHPTVLFLFYVTMCGYYWSSFFQRLALIFMYPQRVLSVLSILPTPLWHLNSMLVFHKHQTDQQCSNCINQLFSPRTISSQEKCWCTSYSGCDWSLVEVRSIESAMNPAKKKELIFYVNFLVVINSLTCLHFQWRGW